ncbi:MAG: metallophosphoesterase family protein [Methanosarcinales archaeon]|nr:metallophosphoesterase family protein [Methanosarcinales archaeon]
MRILFISDIHGNIDALDAVLKIPHDAVYCLGDLVEYGPNPVECIDRIHDLGIPTICGNHDRAVAFGIDCGCGYVYKHLSIATRQYTLDKLSDEHKDLLKILPAHMEFTADGYSFYITHGAPHNPYEYIKSATPEHTIQHYFEGIDTDFAVVGHTHMPFVRQIGNMTLINTGSVGQSRDGDTRAACAILDTNTGNAEIVRVEYDLENVCRKIEQSMPHADELVRILRDGK